MAGGGGSPLELPDSPIPYSISLLFLIFLGIMLAWETLLGSLSFLAATKLTTVLRSVLVDRLKEELLALGVVSLVLAFVASALQSVCVDVRLYSRRSEDIYKGDCPEGKEPLFPLDVINASHYMLFWTAVVQIAYTLLGGFFTVMRFRRIADMEQVARSNMANRKALRAAAKAAARKQQLPAPGAAAASAHASGSGHPVSGAEVARSGKGAGLPTILQSPHTTQGGAGEAAAADAGALGRAPSGSAKGAGGVLGHVSEEGATVALPPQKEPTAGEEAEEQAGGSSGGRKGKGRKGKGNSRAARAWQLCIECFGPNSGCTCTKAMPSSGGERSGWKAWCGGASSISAPTGDSSRHLIATLTGGITLEAYEALRGALLLRIQRYRSREELRTVNLATAAEQLVQHEISQVHAHTWVQICVISLMLLYRNNSSYQVGWISAIGLLVLLAAGFKMRAVMIELVRMISRIRSQGLVSVAGATVHGEQLAVAQQMEDARSLAAQSLSPSEVVGMEEVWVGGEAPGRAAGAVAPPAPASATDSPCVPTGSGAGAAAAAAVAAAGGAQGQPGGGAARGPPDLRRLSVPSVPRVHTPQPAVAAATHAPLDLFGPAYHSNSGPSDPAGPGPANSFVVRIADLALGAGPGGWGWAATAGGPSTVTGFGVGWGLGHAAADAAGWDRPSVPANLAAASRLARTSVAAAAAVAAVASGAATTAAGGAGAGLGGPLGAAGPLACPAAAAPAERSFRQLGRTSMPLPHHRRLLTNTGPFPFEGDAGVGAPLASVQEGVSTGATGAGGPEGGQTEPESGLRRQGSRLPRPPSAPLLPQPPPFPPGLEEQQAQEVQGAQPDGAAPPAADAAAGTSQQLQQVEAAWAAHPELPKLSFVSMVQAGSLLGTAAGATGTGPGPMPPANGMSDALVALQPLQQQQGQGQAQSQQQQQDQQQQNPSPLDMPSQGRAPVSAFASAQAQELAHAVTIKPPQQQQQGQGQAAHDHTQSTHGHSHQGLLSSIFSFGRSHLLGHHSRRSSEEAGGKQRPKAQDAAAGADGGAGGRAAAGAITAAAAHANGHAAVGVAPVSGASAGAGASSAHANGAVHYHPQLQRISTSSIQSSQAPQGPPSGWPSQWTAMEGATPESSITGMDIAGPSGFSGAPHAGGFAAATAAGAGPGAAGGAAAATPSQGLFAPALGRLSVGAPRLGPGPAGPMVGPGMGLHRSTSMVLSVEGAEAVAALEDNLERLFWLRWPRLLLWLVEMATIINACSLTICLFYLVDTGRDWEDYRSELAVWVPLMAGNLLVAFYIGWVVVPQYALCSTALAVPPATLALFLRWCRSAQEEEGKGVSGLVSHALAHTQRTRRLAARAQARRALDPELQQRVREAALERKSRTPFAALSPANATAAAAATGNASPAAAASQHGAEQSEGSHGGRAGSGAGVGQGAAGARPAQQGPSAPPSPDRRVASAAQVQPQQQEGAGAGPEGAPPLSKQSVPLDRASLSRYGLRSPSPGPSPQNLASRALGRSSMSLGRASMGMGMALSKISRALGTAGAGAGTGAGSAGPGAAVDAPWWGVKASKDTEFALPPDLPAWGEKGAAAAAAGRDNDGADRGQQHAQPQQRLLHARDSMVITSSAACAIADAFVSSLAYQAGIVVAHGGWSAPMQAHATLERHAPVFLGYVAVWRQKARVAAGVASPPQHGFVVQGGVWLRPLLDAFRSIDVNRTAYISPAELQEHMRHSLGTRVSKGELQAMLAELGLVARPGKAGGGAAGGGASSTASDTPGPGAGGSPVAGGAAATAAGAGEAGAAGAGARGPRAVTWPMFVCFCAFVYLDTGRKGRITLRSLDTALRLAGLPLPLEELAAMFSLADVSKDGQLSSVEFLALLQDVKLQE